MTKKRIDPALIALQDKLGKALVDFERWYGRLSRAFARCEKHRRQIKSIRRRIEKHPQGSHPA